MEVIPKPTRLAELASISVPYASQILGGSRSPSDAVAVRIFHAFGLKMGRLVKLTDDEIAVFAKMQGIEAQPAMHAPADSETPTSLSGGNGDDVAAHKSVNSCGLSLPHERRASVPNLTTGAATFFDDLTRAAAE